MFMTNHSYALTFIGIQGGPGFGPTVFENLSWVQSFPQIQGSANYPAMYKYYEDEIAKISGDKVLIGHSFGGILAAHILVKSKKVKNIIGIIVIGAPLDLKSANEVSRNHERYSIEERFFAPQNRESGMEMLSRDDYNSGLTHEGANLMEMFSLSRKLKKIDVKKLYVVGEYDKTVFANTGKRLAKKSRMEFVEIEEAGHFVLWESPKKFTHAVKTWMNP